MVQILCGRLLTLITTALGKYGPHHAIDNPGKFSCIVFELCIIHVDLFLDEL